MEDYGAFLKKTRQQQRSNNKVPVKSLTLCPRKEVFSIIEPFAVTDEEFCRYVVGEASA